MTDTTDQTPGEKLSAPRPLDFHMQSPSQTNWGWAATAVSIKRFYDRGSSETQCNLVTMTFMANCCSDGGSSKCNRNHPLNKALSDIGVLATYLEDEVAFSEIENQIKNMHPVIVELSTEKEDVLLLVIHGCDSSNPANPKIITIDTNLTKRTFEFKGFPQHYNAGSTWTKTYFTRSR